MYLIRNISSFFTVVIIMALSCRYRHDDNDPSFDDYLKGKKTSQFGGWKTPAIKQFKYIVAVNVCGKNRVINKNWRP